MPQVTHVILIGNVFDAQCMNITVNKDEKEVKLKKSAKCIIAKETEERERKREAIKYTGYSFRDIKIEVKYTLGERLDSWKELICRNVQCPNPKKLYKKHSGTHKVAPFKINRVYERPSVCFKELRHNPDLRAAVEKTFTITPNRKS